MDTANISAFLDCAAFQEACRKLSPSILHAEPGKRSSRKRIEGPFAFAAPISPKSLVLAPLANVGTSTAWALSPAFEARLNLFDSLRLLNLPIVNNVKKGDPLGRSQCGNLLQECLVFTGFHVTVLLHHSIEGCEVIINA
jgi:hypothetical protein